MALPMLSVRSMFCVCSNEVMCHMQGVPRESYQESPKLGSQHVPGPDLRRSQS